MHNETAGGKTPEIITYSLRADQGNSDEYYRTIASFCDEMLALDGGQGSETLQAFLNWSEGNTGVLRRDRWEAQHEMLSLGTLWRVYGDIAVHSNKGWRKVSAWLAELRERSKMLKGAVDPLRGWLGGWSGLYKKTNFVKMSEVKHLQLNEETLRSAQGDTFLLGQPPMAPPNMQNVELLLEWLAATGEYKEETRRLSDWVQYLACLQADNRKAALQDITDLAGWFEQRSLEKLGKFTENVEGFLAGKHARHRWQEDYLFTGRRRVEYHLNMLGTELLNRSLRASFRGTQQKILIVPPCMKARPEEECEAVATALGERCAHCTPACRVNQVTRLGEKKGFAVFIIPDDLKTFSSDPLGTGTRQAVGLVGVSCPLTNTSGGWEMKRLGVPAQGLLLDYCGCKWHWHKEGIPTDINFGELVKLMGLEG